MRRESVTHHSEYSRIPIEDSNTPSITSSGMSESPLVPQGYWSSSEEQSDKQDVVKVDMHNPPKRNVRFFGIDTEPSTSKDTDDTAQSKPSTSKVTEGINYPFDPQPSTSGATHYTTRPAVPKTSPEDEPEYQPAESLPKKLLDIYENKLELHEAIKCYEEIMYVCRFLKNILSPVPQLACFEIKALQEESLDRELLEYDPDVLKEEALNILTTMTELGECLYFTDIEILTRCTEEVIPMTQDLIEICSKLERKISVYKNNVKTFSIFTPKRSQLKWELKCLLNDLQYSTQNLKYYSGRFEGEVIGSPRPRILSRTPSVSTAIKIAVCFLLALSPGIGLLFYDSPKPEVDGPCFDEQNSSVSI